MEGQRNSSSFAQKLIVAKSTRIRSLRQHVKECGQIFACDNLGCPKSFNAEGELTRHLRVCGGDPCPCGHVVHSMNHFVAHQTACKVSFFFDFSFIRTKRLIVSSSTLFLAFHQYPCEGQELPLYSGERRQAVSDAEAAGRETPPDQSC